MSDWVKRGQWEFEYNGETFYTITPIPFYVKRRSLLLNLASNYLEKKGTLNVLDFGCGDGFYINYFSKLNSELCIYGIDISETMLDRAKKKNPESVLKKGMTIEIDQKFDVIYCFAVMAHILRDDDVEALIKQMYSKLNRNGILMIFEQTAPVERKGETFIRRSPFRYIQIAESLGFTKDEARLIVFPAHQFFEKYIAKTWYNLFLKGKETNLSRIEANRSKLFILLSKIFLSISFNPVRDISENYYGNSFLVFKKKF